MWLTQLLERNRQCWPDRWALVDERRRLTWSQFHDRTLELARGLAELGIERGDRVAVLSKDRVEVLETYFALARLGALFVPLNHSLAVPRSRTSSPASGRSLSSASRTCWTCTPTSRRAYGSGWRWTSPPSGRWAP